MSDLRPYTCTAEECSQPEKTYSTLKYYLEHEIMSHEVQSSLDRFDEYVKRVKESITCLFCGQRTTEGMGKNFRGKHVGQHMEEIAFMVVPKAYEDWEFYSEASSEIQADPHTLLYRWYGHRCNIIWRVTGRQCDRVFSTENDLVCHEATMHNSGKEKVRCQICTEKRTFSERLALIRHMGAFHPDVDFRGKRWRRTSSSRKRSG